MNKSWIFLTVFTAVLHTFVLSQDLQDFKTPLCSQINSKTPCVLDIECSCRRPDNKTLVCTSKKTCGELTLFERFLRKLWAMQPCPNVFKSRCASNADCPCSTTKLICENSECVRAKRRRMTFTKSS